MKGTSKIDNSLPAIRILLVDDHQMVREGLRVLLETQMDFTIVGEAEDGQEAIKQHDTLRPDIALIDLRMPILSGVEAIRAIRQRAPEAKLIALTSFNGDADARKAVAAGANGFLLKKAPQNELFSAVRHVNAGNKWFSPDIQAILRASSAKELTRRELEVLGLVMLGFRNQEIGEHLGVSLNTIKSHIEAILSKLGAVDRTEAVVTALKRGLVHLP